MEDHHRHRWLAARLGDALSDTPVVLVNGARQTGKSTLVQACATSGDGRYFTLDEPTVAAAARDDPMAFVEQEDGLTIIDEAQRVPALFAAIKRTVDRDRRPGRFLLTGSADVFLLPNAAESLAGRMEVLTLQPLSQGELARGKPRFLKRLFEGRPVPLLPAAGAALADRVVTGGYPEVQLRPRTDRRRAWFDAYVSTITQRDIRDLSNISDLAALPRLLALLAIRSGSLMNVAEISRVAAIPQVTLHRYLALLEATFLFQPLPAWHANLGKRLIKAPKAYLVDSGLACAVSGVQSASLAGSPHFGGLLESFVLCELRRECAALTDPHQVFHYRSAGGVEVDFVIEDGSGRCAGIEVKATRSLGERHFGGLKDLHAGMGKQFACGIVLYGGEETVRFGDRLWAVPIAGASKGA